MKSRKRKEPNYGVMRREMAILKKAPEALQRQTIEGMTPAQTLAFDADFETWAHQNQLPPCGEGWRVWLMMAGRGFGKTRAGAEWIYRLGRGKPGLNMALVGATIADARSIMVEGVSGLLSIARRLRQRVNWEPSLNRITWPNGSRAQLFSGDNADGLRGPEHDFAWCDELSKWRQAEGTWMNLQFGLRHGQRPRAVVTTTPRSMALLNQIEAEPDTIKTGGKTSDNINLDEKVIDLLTRTYGGTRIGRQELDGEMIADAEGALWSWETIEKARVGRLDRLVPDRGKAEGPLHHAAHGPLTNAGKELDCTGAHPPPSPPLQGAVQFDRIVVGVDPPAGVGDTVDACGIVVAGSIGEQLYVLEDASVQGLSPEGWSNRVAAAALRWGATTIIAEANNGGAMVKSVIDAAGAALKVRLVHASIGKSARAEPIALKFEAGRAFLAGEFPELEAELAGMIAGGGYEGPGRSPDRADAMVWALTALSETRSGMPRIRRL